MKIRVAEDILPGTKTAPHLAAFLSEVVQYWTAIYPELADHQRVQSTLKPRKAGKAIKKAGKVISSKR